MQDRFREQFTPEYGRALEHLGNGYTALVDGAPIGCAGLAEQWEGRALAWALIGADAGPYFTGIVRAMRRGLDLTPWRRIEAQVDVDFPAGIRLAHMLGFEVESKMRAFTSAGRDAFMFVRIRQ
jgi:RimJ/RimL family protein N-acetyltransferase